MGAEGISLTKQKNMVESKTALPQAVQFIMPSLVTMIISMALFSMLKDLYQPMLNTLSITIMAAVVLSLAGTSGIQVLMYRMLDSREYDVNEGIIKGTRIGIVYAVIFSAIACGLMYFYLCGSLKFSFEDFVYFTILTTLFSLTWIVCTAFWETERYKYPAVIFSVSYMLILIFSYVAYQTRAEYIIVAYIAGIAIGLVVLSWFNFKYVVQKHTAVTGFTDDVLLTVKIMIRNMSAIFFQFAYILVIFLDKIIVWIFQGLSSEQGMALASPYSVASFMGFVPIFSIVTVAYYSGQMKNLTTDIFNGTLADIRTRIQSIKSLYNKCLATTILIAIGLLVPISVFGTLNRNDFEVFKICVTIAVGVIFLLGIIYNSTILPLFGKTHISAVSILFVCLGEVISIFFVSQDVWFVALGFAAGSAIGFTISQYSIARLFSEFEYKLFHFLMINKY